MATATRHERFLITQAVSNVDRNRWYEAASYWWELSKRYEIHDPFNLLYLARAMGRYCDSLAERMALAA